MQLKPILMGLIEAGNNTVFKNKLQFTCKEMQCVFLPGTQGLHRLHRIALRLKATMGGPHTSLDTVMVTMNYYRNGSC